MANRRKKRPGTSPEPSESAEKEKPEGLSQEEMARLVGCAQSTVSRAIKRGDVEPLTNGRLPLAAGAVLKKLRIEDEKWSDETDELNRRNLRAETEEREAKARRRQLDLDIATGKYVELAAVKQDAADMRERILAVLRAIPQRVAKSLECSCQRAAVVETKIRSEVERAIAEMAETEFDGGEDGRWGPMAVCALLVALSWLWSTGGRN